LLHYKEEVYSLRSQLKIAKESLDLQAAEFAFRQSQHETELSHLRRIENSLRRKLGKLESERSDVTHKYDVDVNLQIEKTKTENDRLSQRLAHWKGKAKSARDEIQILRARIEDLSGTEDTRTKVVDSMRRLRRENQVLKEAMVRSKSSPRGHTQCEYISEQERTKLADLISLPDNDWASIFGKIGQLVSENDVLHARLSEMYPARFPPRIRVDELGNMRYAMDSPVPHVRRAANELLRSKFSSLVDKHNYELSKHLAELHDSIFNRESTALRRVVLLVVFMRRLRFATESVIDPRALLVFEGRPGQSSEVKLRDLRGEFTRITREFVVTKQDLIEAIQIRKDLEGKLDDLSKKHEESQSASNVSRVQVISLKGRLLALQEELSTLVSPDQYRDLEARCTLALNARENAQSEMESLKQEVAKRTEIASEMRERVDRTIMKAEICKNREQKLRKLCDERDEQIEALQALLRERTKEVLALERVVQRQSETEKQTTAQLKSLAVENVQLLSMEAHQPIGQFINPVFLGQ
jgi:chromosome segregation ATPase